MKKKPNQEPKPCVICNQIYTPFHRGQKVCRNEECRKASRRKRSEEEWKRRFADKAGYEEYMRKKMERLHTNQEAERAKAAERQRKRFENLPHLFCLACGKPFKPDGPYQTLCKYRCGLKLLPKAESDNTCEVDW